MTRWSRRTFAGAAVVLAAGAVAAPWWARGHDRRREVAGVPTPTSMPAPAEGEVRVGIDNFAFKPAEVRVRAGTRVTWVNHDDVPHTVTADDRSFGSKAMDTDEQFSRVFGAPGDYPYYCAIHTHMTGRVVVVGR